MKRILVTGSSGLIGSETVRYFDELGWDVVGIDNNMRKALFGPGGDTSCNLQWLKESTRRFRSEDVDVRSRRAVRHLLSREKFDLIMHCAAQPSNDLSRDRPLDDFDINAVGTINLLEAARQNCPEAPFITLSSNKVYGDTPNELPLQELDTRYEYLRPEDFDGIDESCPVDQSMHSIFGASKLAADIMTQEYGRYYNMPTCVFRCSCLTGSRHAGVSRDGFLKYMVRVAASGGRYTIIGYRGKQVRDQLHAFDVVQAAYAFAQKPRNGEVYNLGGGRENSVSVLEAIFRFQELTGQTIKTEYQPLNRLGDHVCYISNFHKFRTHYPGWEVTRSLDDIFEELVRAEWDAHGSGKKTPPNPAKPAVEYEVLETA